jgi:valyl-tRNA synthetase
LDESLIDEAAEAEIGQAITLTRALRRWRDLAGVPVKQVLAARADDTRPHELVSRLARVEFSEDGGEPIASFGGVELLETEGVDPQAVAARIEERREKLRAEVSRGEGKLANEGFVAKAPAEVVDAEREKLAAYRAELEELGG